MLFVGRIFLGLRWSSAMLAISLALPTPLFTVSPGTAGFVFAADLVAVVLGLRWLFGGLTARSDCARLPLGYFLGAAAILVAIPTWATAMGYLIFPNSHRFMTQVSLGIARGVAYLVIFWAMARRMQREERPDRFILVQCFTFVAVVLCALVIQYGYGISLGVRVETQSIVRDATEIRYGGGFMGIYRGAVGAFGVGILAAIPILLSRIRGGLWLTVFAYLIVMGAMLAVGTRQGVVIGSFAFFLSLLFSVRSQPPGHRLMPFLRVVGLILLLGIVSTVAARVLMPAKFSDWIKYRFAGVESIGSIVATARERGFGAIGQVVDNMMAHPMIMFTGIGYGTEASGGIPSIVYIDSEFFFVWQHGGLPMLGTYLVFLVLMLRRFRWNRFMVNPSDRAYVATAFAVLLGSIPLLYGHFFILHTAASNAPIAYWIGLCSAVRWVCSPNRSIDYTARPNPGCTPPRLVERGRFSRRSCRE